MPNQDFKLSDHAQQPLIRTTAENLIWLMKQRAIDSATLSRVTGLSTATINTIRRGVANPTLSTLAILAQFFGISLAELTEAQGHQSYCSLEHHHVHTIPLVKLNEVERFFSTGHAEKSYTTALESNQIDMLLAVLITNDALYPQFPAGTICVLTQAEQPADGDIVLGFVE